MAKFQKKTKKGPVPHKVLSDRGVHLEQMHQKQQDSNIRHGQPVVIGQNDNGDNVIVNIGQKCPKCKRSVRGPNHANGEHHLGIVPKCGR